MLGVIVYVTIFSLTRLANPEPPTSPPFLSDLNRYFFPSFAFLHKSLLTGELPLWNPYQLAGVPFLALHTPGAAYPPLLALALLPPRVALTAHVVGHLMLAGIFASLFARRLGLGNAGSLAVGVAFAGSYPMVDAVDNTAYLSTFVWLPAAFWATEGLAKRCDARQTALLALVLALGFLGGHSQGALYLGQAVGLYALFRAAASREDLERWRFVGLFGAAGILAAGLVAMQLLPTLEYIRGAARSTGRLTLLQAWGYPVYTSLGETLSGRAPSYFGVPVLIGPLGVAALAASRLRREASFFLCLLLLTFDFMRGLEGHVFALYYKLPFGDLFRIPLRMSFVYQLAAAMLIGIGGDALLSRLRPHLRLATVAALLLVGGVAADVYLRNPSSRRFAPLVAPAALSGPREIAQLGVRAGHDRIFIEAGGGVPRKSGTIHGFFAVPDYEPLLPERYVRFFDVPQGELWHGYLSTVKKGSSTARQPPEVLDLLSVRYYVNAGRVPGVQQTVRGRAAAQGDVPVYLREQAVPRTYVVHELIHTDSELETLEIIRSGRFDPRREALVQEDVGPVEPHVEGASEHARIKRYRPSHVEIEVSCESTCLVVLTDLYDPNWLATLDGAPVDVTPVNFLFRGVLVTPGSQRLAFEYRPMSVLLGTGISGAAGALVAALLIRRTRRSKRHEVS